MASDVHTGCEMWCENEKLSTTTGNLDHDECGVRIRN